MNLMKLLYVEQPIEYSGEQVVLYPCQPDWENPTKEQTRMMLQFPSLADSIKDTLNTFKQDEFESGQIPLPESGDVMWTHTPGNNRMIAHCMIYDRNGELMVDRLAKMFQSIQKKLDEFDQNIFAMTLMGKSVDDWMMIFPIIESNLFAQGVVYIPTNEELVEVLERLGDLQMLAKSNKPVGIRFK